MVSASYFPAWESTSFSSDLALNAYHRGCFDELPYSFALKVALRLKKTPNDIDGLVFQSFYSPLAEAIKHEILGFLGLKARTFAALGALRCRLLGVLALDRDALPRHNLRSQQSFKLKMLHVILTRDFHPNMKPAAFSAIMMEGALVFPVGTSGITEASAMRRPSSP